MRHLVLLMRFFIPEPLISQTRLIHRLSRHWSQTWLHIAITWSSLKSPHAWGPHPMALILLVWAGPWALGYFKVPMNLMHSTAWEPLTERAYYRTDAQAPSSTHWINTFRAESRASELLTREPYAWQVCEQKEPHISFPSRLWPFPVQSFYQSCSWGWDVQSGSEVWGQPQGSLPPPATHTHTCGCFYKSLLIRGSYSGSVLTAYPCNDGVEERSNFGMTVA